jgi:four helix bundle protein
MKNSIVYEKSFQFSVKIVKLYKMLSDKKEYILAKQILRCGTSIGANIAEANGAISKDDFSAKISISYKECLETQYWLSLLKETDFIDKQQFDLLYNDANEIGKILFAILKTTRIDKND